MFAANNSNNGRKAQNRCEKKWLTAVYDEYHQPIYRFIYRRIGDVETARELTADVFQRLIQVVCRGKTIPENPRAWLYQAAHNIVIDEYRRRQHRQYLPLNEFITDGQVNPEEATHDNLTATQVRAALKLLTPDQQQVIALKFLEGFSNQEIAEIMGKSVGAVKVLQHRGLIALQQMFNPPTAEIQPEPSANGLLKNLLFVESM